MSSSKKYVRSPEQKEAKRRKDRERNRRQREVLTNIKLERGCTDCGYNEHAAALHFDHLSDKRWNIGMNISRKMEDLLEEVAKCEVVCANCHAVRTSERRANREL